MSSEATRLSLELPVSEMLEVARQYGVVRLSAFGSRARGDFTPESDLDLLVEVDEGATLLSLLSLEQKLEEMLGVAVEVLTVEDLHPAIRERVAAEAKPLSQNIGRPR